MKIIDMGLHEITQRLSVEIEVDGEISTSTVEVLITNNIDTGKVIIDIISYSPSLRKSNRDEVFGFVKERIKKVMESDNSVLHLSHILYDFDCDENIIWQMNTRDSCNKVSIKRWNEICEKWTELCNFWPKSPRVLGMAKFIDKEAKK